MASFVFNICKEDVMHGYHGFFESDGFYKIVLVNAVPFDTSAVTVANNHKYWNDVSANWSILADSTFNSLGYEDKSLPGSNLIENNTTDIISWSASDIQWESVTVDARGAIIYEDWDPLTLICAIDFGSTVSVDAGNFTISFPDDGKICDFE